MSQNRNKPMTHLLNHFDSDKVSVNIVTFSVIQLFLTLIP